MWTPVSLQIVNLFSYEQASITFKTGQSTLITGQTVINNKPRSNGSGKSSIGECISLALRGTGLRDINKKDIIRNGQKEGSLIWEMKNEVLKQIVIIERTFNVSKSTVTIIHENGKKREDLEHLHPRETEKAISDYLGISDDDLLNYYLLSKDTYKSFFLSNDSTKKDIINRFSKADIVDNVKPDLDKDIKEVETVITNIQSKISVIDGRLSVFQEQLTKERERDLDMERNLTLEEWNKEVVQYDDERTRVEEEKNQISSVKVKECDTLIKQCKGKLTLFEGTLESKNLEHTTLLLKRDGFNKDIEVINKKHEKEFEDIKTEKEKVTKLGKELTDTNVELTKKKSELELKIQDEIECPSCHHHFSFKDLTLNIPEAKILIEGYENQIQINVKAIDTYRLKYKSLNEKEGNITATIKTESESISKQIREVGEEITKLNKEITDTDTSINSQKTQLRTFNSSRDNLLSQCQVKENRIKELDDLIEKTLDKIDKLENEPLGDNEKEKEVIDNIQKDEVSKNKLLDEKEVENNKLQTLQSWEKRFKAFKSFLANQSIVTIEQYCNYFLQQMHCDLTIMIDGFKELANKSLKEEISIFISRDGISQEKFNKFSGGQKAICDLACIFSMQKLINLTSSSGGFDLIFIDEILESLDTGGMDEVIDALKTLPQTIMMITHVNPDALFHEVNSIKVHYNQLTKISTIL